MKVDFQIESAKAAPATAGTVASLYAKLNNLDWAVIAAQITVAYVSLQIVYLLWKWHKELKN